MSRSGETRLDGAHHHRIVRLPELVLQAVDVQVVNARQPPDFLIDREFDTERGAARQHAPAVAVPVNWQLAMLSQIRHRWKSHRIQAHHDAGSARCQNGIVMAQHLVQIVGDVEREHHLLARPVRQLVDDLHHRRDAFVQRRVRRVRHQFVVLDEINARLAQLSDQFRRLLRRQPHTRLDDRSEDRPIKHGASSRVPSMPNCGPG